MIVRVSKQPSRRFVLTHQDELLDDAFVRQMNGRFRLPLMRYFQRRIRDRTEAEDLTQQVFLRLLSVRDRAGVAHIDGYVFTVAGNLLKDRNRALATRGEGKAPQPDLSLVTELLREAVEDRSPERVLLGRENLADVIKSLDELGEKTRDIYILFRLENMKQREIAELFGIGQSTVEKHVMKATLHLARKYGLS